MSYTGPRLPIYDDCDETWTSGATHCQPYTSFTNSSTCLSGQTLIFTNTSTNPWTTGEPVWYEWSVYSSMPNSNFAYTGLTNSASTNITVKFINSDDYYINLRTSNSYGFTDYDTIVYVGASVASFTYSGSTVSGSTIRFTDTSTGNPTSWKWTIAGGTYTFTGSTTSTSQNPVIKFNQDVDYSVQLKATNTYGTGTDTETISFGEPPMAGYMGASTGSSGQTFAYTDISTGNPTMWAWTIISVSGGTYTFMGCTPNYQNVAIRWNNDDIYGLTLTATNSHGSSHIKYNIQITK